MESVEECLLIEQESMRVEHFIKQTANQWLLRIYENVADVAKLESIGCEVTLADVYSQIEFSKQLQ